MLMNKNCNNMKDLLREAEDNQENLGQDGLSNYLNLRKDPFDMANSPVHFYNSMNKNVK